MKLPGFTFVTMERFDENELSEADANRSAVYLFIEKLKYGLRIAGNGFFKQLTQDIKMNMIHEAMLVILKRLE